MVHACAASWDGRAQLQQEVDHLGVGEKHQGFLLFFNHEKKRVSCRFSHQFWDLNRVAQRFGSKFAGSLEVGFNTCMICNSTSTRQLYLSGRSKLSFLSPASFRHGCFQPSETTDNRRPGLRCSPITKFSVAQVLMNWLTIMVF